jgi:hypothetical protein
VTAVIDGAGEKCEGWLARLIRFDLTVPVSKDTGIALARQFRTAGIKVTRSTDSRGTRHLAGAVDDASAPALLGVRFTFADADVKVASRRARTAQEAAAGRAANAKALVAARICVMCGRPVPLSVSPLIRTCSGICSGERSRQRSMRGYYRRKAERDAMEGS